MGLKNYAACYATGLLLARRLLAKFGLDDKYEGQAAPDGEMFAVEPLEDGPKPFTCVLDGARARARGPSAFF